MKEKIYYASNIVKFMQVQEILSHFEENDHVHKITLMYCRRQLTSPIKVGKNHNNIKVTNRDEDIIFT